MQGLRNKLIAAAVVLIVGVLAWRALDSGRAAPQVDFPLIGGGSLPAAQLKGHVVLVNFWATSCTTCVGEMPKLVRTYQAYAPRGFDLVAVAMSYDQPQFIRTFAASGPAGTLPFPVAYDADGALAKAFGGVNLTPTSFLIDRSGHIVKEYVGPPDFAELGRLLDGLLAQGS